MARVDHNGFRDRPIQPLWHLSNGAVELYHNFWRKLFLHRFPPRRIFGWAALDLNTRIERRVMHVLQANFGQAVLQRAGGSFLAVNEVHLFER